MGTVTKVIDRILEGINRLLTGPMTQEELATSLDKKVAELGQDLNWRVSIVDLMKTIGEDSSLSARKQLAQELGYDGKLDGSAEMNIWLHKQVMDRLA